MFWKEKSVIVGCPIVILLLLILGMHRDLFHTTAYYDVFMHCLGGGLFVISLAGSIWHVWLKKRGDRMLRPVAIKAGLIAGLLLASIIWEIAEVMFNMTPNWTQSVVDTVFDMVCALVGAAIALCFIRMKN